MKNQNILYLSYDGMTDPLGQSQVLPYIKGLSKNGYSFHLISFEKQERFEQNKATIQAICDEAGINWYPLSYTKKPPLLSTIKDVNRMKQLALQLHKEHHFSLVHCRSYIAALIGQKMKRKFNIPFLFDMRGLWADERIDGGIWSLSNPIFKRVYKYFKKKEIQFFLEADEVVSLTHNGKNEILSWDKLKSNPPKIEVIPCCVDLELFNPSTISLDQKTELRRSLGIQESDFVLGYVGSIGTWYLLDEMLDYFKVLKNKKANAKFLFVTGEQPATILAKVKEKEISLTDIIITSTMHKGVPLHISIFNASIFFIRPSYSKKASSPTKQGEIMAMGIPLICNAGVGDTDFIVEKYNSGTVIEKMNHEAYENSISSLIPKDTNHYFAGAQEFFGLETGVDRFLGIYKRIVK